MKTRMHNNSLYTYSQLQDELSTKRYEVLSVIKQNAPVTRQAASEASGIPINSICGRVRELLDLNIIEECGSVYEPGSDKPRAQLRVVAKLFFQVKPMETA